MMEPKSLHLTVIGNPTNIPQLLNGKGEIICKIDNLPLLPGDYFIGLDLWQFGKNLDKIDGVTSFKVEWVDNNNAPGYWNSTRGSIYVNAMWIAK